MVDGIVSRDTAHRIWMAHQEIAAGEKRLADLREMIAREEAHIADERHYLGEASIAAAAEVNGAQVPKAAPSTDWTVATMEVSEATKLAALDCKEPR